MRICKQTCNNNLGNHPSTGVLDVLSRSSSAGVNWRGHMEALLLFSDFISHWERSRLRFSFIYQGRSKISLTHEDKLL